MGWCINFGSCVVVFILIKKMARQYLISLIGKPAGWLLFQYSLEETALMGRRTIFRIRKVLRVPHIITIPKIVTVERSPDSSTIFSSLTGLSSVMAVYASLLSIVDDPNEPHLSESERLETEARVHLRAIHREEAEDADSRRWFAQLRSRSNPPPPWWRLCKSLIWKPSLQATKELGVEHDNLDFHEMKLWRR